MRSERHRISVLFKMITHFTWSAHAAAPPPPAPQLQPKPPGVTTARSWQYHTRIPPLRLTLAVLASAALHLGLLFGFSKSAPKRVVVVEEEPRIVIVPLPQLKDLEEPEPLPGDAEPPPDLGVLVPMQQDLPQLTVATDFVQQVNFASLIEPPDFSQVKLSVPDHIRTMGNLAERIGRIFNPEDLDRVPQAVLQPAPIYPFNLRREGIAATVHVEFVVDSEGRVLNPFVMESTHPGFDEAAISGVAKWKFRPGVRGGRRVNTRMRVPIVFRTVDGDT
jgi:periplasmic protein TonB